jgi:glutamate carboxypeptidase
MPIGVGAGRATGPGVFDMKAGIVQGVWALRALRSVCGYVPPVVCLLTSDEESGSLTSRDLIESAAAAANAALVLEPSQGGALKTSRKGVGLFQLEVTGVPAHAGVDPRAGASAIAELARQVLDLEAENDASGETTVNVGVIYGGTRPNVVAEKASAAIDLRVATAVEAYRMSEHILGLRPHDARTQVRATGGMNRPPMERTAGTAELFQLACRLASELGFELSEIATGGASDGNLCAAAGVPVLDGLGAVGGGAHSRAEHVVIDQMPLRAALVAHLVQQLASA